MPPPLTSGWISDGLSATWPETAASLAAILRVRGGLFRKAMQLNDPPTFEALAPEVVISRRFPMICEESRDCSRVCVGILPAGFFSTVEQ